MLGFTRAIGAHLRVRKGRKLEAGGAETVRSAWNGLRIEISKNNQQQQKDFSGAIRGIRGGI